MPIKPLQNYTRSPLKWAGGKYQLLPKLEKYLPEGERLIEPFVGSGVVFLNTHFKHYLLSDTNADLIKFYQAIQALGPEFIKLSQKFFQPRYNEKQQFYKLREKFNKSQDDLERALLFLYLNRHAYNGLCRYNQSGYFNAPFGRYQKPYFPEAELHYFHEKSQRVTFICQSFQETLKLAKANDVVYCDPPYVPLSKTAHFTQYSGSYFRESEQKSLAKIAKALTKRKIPVIISNHNTKFTREIYAPAKLIKLNVRRLISCKSNSRGMTPELLAIF